MPDPKITHDDLATFAGRAVNLPKEIADEKRRQVNTLRERLTAHIAKNPGFSLVKMLHAGSVAKGAPRCAPSMTSMWRFMSARTPRRPPTRS